jgi:hypothetical protein
LCPISGGREGRASGYSASGGRPPIPSYCVPRPATDSGEYDVDLQPICDSICNVLLGEIDLNKCFVIIMYSHLNI